MARAGPTSRANRWVPPAPGITPSRISGWPRVASSATTRQSQASASSQPPPRAYPVTEATTGLGIRATASKAAESGPARSAISTYDIPAISLMSAPAAKVRSPP